jgi:hypothetical protein
MMDFDPRDLDDERPVSHLSHGERSRGDGDTRPTLGRAPSCADRETERPSRDHVIDLRERDHDARARHRDGPSRGVFERHVDLPRRPEREVVHDGRREYRLRGSETRTLATVGAFRVVSSRDLLDARGTAADPRAGDLRHLREQGLIETARIPGTRDHAIGLTAAGARLLEANRTPGLDRPQAFHAGIKRTRELEHDVHVYRAYEHAARAIEDRGGRVMESFFSTVKSELADRFPSFSDAKMEIFDYIEVFYNQRRRHSTLGQISPAAFERRAAA